MKQFDLIIDGSVQLTSSWVHCMQAAYVWLGKHGIAPDDYIKYQRLQDDYMAFAYYDKVVGGHLVQIVIREHE